MKMVPYRKDKEFWPMASIFDNFINRFWAENEVDENQRMMAIDIIEHDDRFEISANLPGFKKNDISMNINENQLIIEAHKEEKSEEKSGSYCRCERYHGDYRRVLSLSDLIDKDKIDAKFEDGVLNIKIPKLEPKPAKEIKIS
ncbi:MAG: Hsp20/alpha crystallin family protein [Candidatus Cloacimonetes bacterium]|nr:Hsp20/alpha crystallin family protein [Candidatus Cloacimonadota bacterium]